MYDLLYDDNYFYIVTEASSFGDMAGYLLSLLRNDELVHLNEISVQYIAKQLFSALAYLHQKKIAHRDIKLENIIITRKSGDRIRVSLIDFGFASFFSDTEPLKRKLGSKQYIAPEILTDDTYTCKSDIWSATIAVYILLTMSMPKFGKDLKIYRE